jgi:glutathione synthase/RimK-type ligase-like ATP-grasp enzyme
MDKRCAYLTMDDFGDFVSDAGLSFMPMAELGWEVEMVPWRREVDWNDYGLVYICSPWDYQNDVDGFVAVLERIETSSAKLVNCLELVHWNLEKDYLRDLEKRGAGIVPSLFHDTFDEREIGGWFAAHRSDRVVVKPLVGAGADHIFVLTDPVPDDVTRQLRQTYASRPFFVQPFMERVQSEGEYSTFFFNGEYSHAILKRPKAGDFRSQEEHGADIMSVEASQDLIDTARDVVALVEPLPVYARADFVRDDNDRLLVMELELTEPSLYFRTAPGSAARFVRALTSSL